jgi:tetratricopeptide (TPR) repeat protein
MTMPQKYSPQKSSRTATEPGGPSFPVSSERMGYRLRKQTTALLHAAAAFALICAVPIHAQTTFPDILAVNGPAYRALQEGRVDEAQALLNATLVQNPNDATAHQLLCRVFYAQDEAEAAIHHCELAVATDSGNSALASDDQLWLGRAYGMKARHAGPITGFTLARKVRSSFFLATQLNPSNVAAFSDLGEYYIAAPSIVGGGNDKAQALATRIMPQFPTLAHRLRAMIAEDAKDLPTAEAEFKLAVATQKSTDGHSLAEAWIDLAQFYQAHNRPDDALAAIKSAIAADRTHGPVLVDAASLLTAIHRAPDLAERCLRDYLAGHAKSDAAPTFKVHLQLARLLAARGDSTDASQEVATAAALAPSFTRSARPTQGL